MNGVHEAVLLAEWGPVCRGFSALLPSGERGSVVDIRVRAGGVELVVRTGLFAQRLHTVRADEIDAVLPAARRIVIGDANRGDRDGGERGEVTGGIVRFPAREGLARALGRPPTEAA